jgi:ABC-2 type transport system permease protein
MTRIFRLLALSVWRDSLSQWSWRSFLITLVIGQAVTPILGILVWSAVLPGDSQVSTYYVALLVVQLMTVSYEHHTLSNTIYGGELANILTRPQPVVLGVLGSNIALRIWHVIFGLPLIVIAAAAAGISLEPEQVLLSLPALVLGAALRFVFTYILALTALWTERAHGMVALGETLIFLLGGIAAPILLLSEPYRTLGQALPFWSMLGLPAEAATGTLTGTELAHAYGAQLGWLITLVVVAAVVWRTGLRRFTAVGG